VRDDCAGPGRVVEAQDDIHVRADFRVYLRVGADLELSIAVVRSKIML
jgi:hypothetical protein